MKVKLQTIKKVVEKNDDAFNEIYYSYKKIIFYIVYSIIKDYTNTQDLTQEIFVKIDYDLRDLYYLF